MGNHGSGHVKEDGLGSDDGWGVVSDIAHHRLATEHAPAGLPEEQTRVPHRQIVLKCGSTGGSPLGSPSYKRCWHQVVHIRLTSSKIGKRK